MACAPIPSVTLYGTTQITTQVQVTATSLSTYLGEPAISLTTFIHTQCDAFGLKCGPQQTSSLVTVTPTMTSTVTEVVNTQTVLTSVVPQRTIYSPCPDGRQPTNTGGKPAAETNKGGGDGDGGKESQEPVTQFTPPPAILTPSESTFQGVVSQTRNQAPSPPPPSTVIASSSSVTQPQISSSQPVRSNSNTEPALSYSSVTHSSSAYASISSIYSSSAYSAIASAGAQATTESSSPKGAVVAGAVLGGILGLCSLCCLLMWFRRRMGRDDDTGRSVGTVDYWERRFRELEADGGDEKVGSEGHFGDDGDLVEGEKSKKLRLTLDLGSKNMSTRPASRLSAISAFFSSKPRPEPFVGMPPSKSSQTLNFSRPRFGARAPSTRSVRSGRSGRSGSVKSKISGKSRTTSIKSASHWLRFYPESTEAGSNARINAGQGRVPDDGYIAGVVDIGRDGVVDGQRRVGGGNERRAMEWIRSDNLDHDGYTLRSGSNGLDELDDGASGIATYGTSEGRYPSPLQLKRFSQQIEASSPNMDLGPGYGQGTEASHASIRSESPSTPSLLPTHHPLAGDHRVGSTYPASTGQGFGQKPLAPLGRQLTPPKGILRSPPTGKHTQDPRQDPLPASAWIPKSSSQPAAAFSNRGSTEELSSPSSPLPQQTASSLFGHPSGKINSALFDTSSEVSFAGTNPRQLELPPHSPLTDLYTYDLEAPSDPANRRLSARPLERLPPVDSVKQYEQPTSRHRPTFADTATRSAPALGRKASGSKGKPKAPPLQLSREAITPSLWIDEEVYEQFRQQEATNNPNLTTLSAIHGSVGIGSLEQSHFSADSSVAPLSAFSDSPYDGIEVYAQPSPAQNHPADATSEATPPRKTSDASVSQDSRYSQTNSPSSRLSLNSRTSSASLTSLAAVAPRSERSAVTPRLLTFGATTSDFGWKEDSGKFNSPRPARGRGEEEEERMLSIYQDNEL